ncbi:HMG (high mobility group) box containing protein [Sarcoptes scabiei]|nr:HMG (high mobility group) box containing protein [Sarcoptes scabiei]
MTPYMRYSKKVWDEVRNRYPELKVWEISKIVGQMWRDLDENEKHKYTEEFEFDKIEYNEQLKNYHNSPSYQSWINHLRTKESEEKDAQTKRKKTNHQQNAQNSPQRPENRYSLQSVDVDNNEEYFSIKHLAAARYFRNNRLVNEIFSDTIVPDVRAVPQHKIPMLLKQRASLEIYQKKLDAELEQIEQDFQQKKSALLESSRRFQEELKERNALNEEKMIRLKSK